MLDDMCMDLALHAAYLHGEMLYTSYHLVSGAVHSLHLNEVLHIEVKAEGLDQVQANDDDLEASVIDSMCVDHAINKDVDLKQQ